MLAPNMSATQLQLDAVNLLPLMELTAGEPEVVVGLIDGPIDTTHADLAAENIRTIPSSTIKSLERGAEAARTHGTYIAGIIAAKRGSPAPAIAPGCTLLTRPIFIDPTSGNTEVPSATPGELADAIVDCVKAGACVLNLSVAIAELSPNKETYLERALDYAAERGVLVVVAAGNQGTIGGSAITRHPWTIPVAACDIAGRPTAATNLGRSTARKGLMAPGDAVTSLGSNGQSVTLGGTSAAVPFVTGAVALLWSLFRGAGAAELKVAVTRADVRRATVVPLRLDAWSTYQRIENRRGHR